MSAPILLSAHHRAMHALYSEHHGWLQNWLRGKLGCAADAADLAQDTFLRILLKRELREIGMPRAFLRTIARGLVIDHWRREELQRAYLESIAHLPEAQAPSPEARELVLELLEEISRMLDGLKPKVRTAFLLAQCEDLSHRQIAERMGVSQRSVERYVAEALYHGEHERAWQQVSALNEELQGRFKALPGGVAYGTLDSSAQRLQRRQALKLLSLLVAGGAVAWVGRDSLPWQRLSADYSTATGERRSIELVDGTRLQLNTDSAVDVRYDAGQRLILLARGEIFLASGADTQSPTHRPLRVRTAQGLFEALGTRFNVRLQDAATCLSVSEGSVRIDAFGARPLQAPVAEAGQSYRIAADGVRRLERPQMDAVAWADGLIVTRDMRLADFLAEVGRYRNGYLGCAAEVADLRLSGVYRLDDTDKLLQVLARTLPVRLQRHTRWWVRVVAA